MTRSTMRALLTSLAILTLGFNPIRPAPAAEIPGPGTNRRYSIILSVDPRGQFRSNSPVRITGLDFQQFLGDQGESGTFDEHTIEVVAFDPQGGFKIYDSSRTGYEQHLLPWRLEEYFGIDEIDLHFVMPDHECTLYAVYFDTVESGVGQPDRVRGLVGDGDWFREGYKRRPIGPSSVGDLADLDGDGDLDLFVGGVESFIYCYENLHSQVGEHKMVFRGRLTSGGQVLNMPRSGSNRSWMTVSFYDWNRDGDPDLFASFTDGPDSQEIVYYRNTTSQNGGQLTFTRVGAVYTSPNVPAVSESLGGKPGAGWFPKPAFVEDWDGDGDGRIDVLVAKKGDLYLHRNLGPGGSFDYRLDNGVALQAGGANIGPGTLRVDCADIDNDTDLDLIATSHDWEYAAFVWYENVGTRQDPQFASAQLIGQMAHAYSGLKLGDFHGNDGLLDIAVGTFWIVNGDEQYPKSYGGLWKNVGTPTNPSFELVFADAGSMYTEEFQRCDAGQQNGVRAVDWDNDGDSDLVGSSSDGLALYWRNLTNNTFPVFDDVHWLMVNDGGAGYPIRMERRPEAGYARMDMSDWNNDSYIDMVIGDEDARVFVYLNDGLGNDPPTFRPGIHVWANGKPLDCLKRGSPLVCDWDNDGKKDLLFGMAPKQDDPETPLDWPAKDGNKTDDEGFLYYRNVGTDAAPVLAYPSWVRAGGQIITYTRPNMGNFVDWDGDGLKDFIGCDFEDNVRLYRNVGSGSTGVEPSLSPADGVIILEEYCKTQVISGAEVMDWRGDGDLDILTGMGHAGSSLRYYERDYLEDVLNATEPVAHIVTASPGNPGPVHSLKAAKQSAGTVQVSWTNPDDSDVVGAMVRYSTETHPVSITDGFLAIDMPSAAGAQVSFTHVVQTNQDLYYCVFARDLDGNYATPACVMATEPVTMWFDETFDNYATGNLGGQGGWTTASGSNSCRVQNSVRTGSSGNAVEMFGTNNVYDENSNSTFGPIVGGYHKVSFDMRGDPNVPGNQAIIEVYGLGQKITRVYWSNTFNLLHGPDGAHFDNIVPSPVAGRWYHIEIGIDLDNRTLDAWVDGIRETSGVPMFTSVGQIDLIGLTGYGYEGIVAPSYIDNLRGERSVPNSPLATLTDFDGDGDVDQSDFGYLQECLSDGLVVASAPCAGADLNSDARVDATDTAIFLLCMNGAKVEPNCD